MTDYQAVYDEAARVSAMGHDFDAGIAAVVAAARAEVLGFNREALVLRLWDEWLVRPESLGEIVVDTLLESLAEGTR